MCTFRQHAVFLLYVWYSYLLQYLLFLSKFGYSEVHWSSEIYLFSCLKEVWFHVCGSFDVVSLESSVDTLPFPSVSCKSADTANCCEEDHRLYVQGSTIHCVYMVLFFSQASLCSPQRQQVGQSSSFSIQHVLQ